MPFLHLQGDDGGAEGDKPCRGSIGRWFGHEVALELGIDEAGRQVAAAEGLVFQDRRQELAVAEDAVDFIVVERQMQPVDGSLAGGRVGDQLGNHRIVIHRDLAALIDTGIHAHALACRLAIAHQLADGWKKAARRVLGIDTRLDGPAVGLDVILR